MCTMLFSVWIQETEIDRNRGQDRGLHHGETHDRAGRGVQDLQRGRALRGAGRCGDFHRRQTRG